MDTKKAVTAQNRKLFLALGVITLALIVCTVAPISPNAKNIVIKTVLFAYMATAWNLMCGYTGRLSLGHSAYIAVGAYTTIILYQAFNITPWIGMIAGGILAMALMLIIAFPCFRFGLKGPYFTLASIAVMEIMRYLLVAMRDITGGSLGMQLKYTKTGSFWEGLAIFQFGGKEKNPYLAIIIIFWLLAVLLVWKMERTRYYLEAIREDDDAAAALGIAVNKNLIKSALISAFLVALGGGFYVQFYRFIQPDEICGAALALNLALVTIVGGSGTILGPTIGAILVIPLSEMLRTSLSNKVSGLDLFIYGVLLIIMIIFLPKGIISIPGIIKHKRAAAAAKTAGGEENV